MVRVHRGTPCSHNVSAAAWAQLSKAHNINRWVTLVYSRELAWPVQVAQFSFALPPPEQMGELLPWMQAALHMLDLLGSYKLKPDQKVPLPLLNCGL